MKQEYHRWRLAALVVTAAIWLAIGWAISQIV